MLKKSNNPCPSCNTSEMSVFYEAKNVPTNSCLMFSTEAEATSYPRGDVVLAFCNNCGFISNIAFNPSKIDYRALAPEEQGFSGTFNAYVQRLATHLIETYNLQNKHISEIGCGRGDFLALLCKLSNSAGVGIDPSTVSGMIESDISARLTFIRDYYSEQYSKYLGDLICCRHTLEHISNTADFVKSIRSAITTQDVNVFFEVPDVSRILTEVAFWDIYYEHCSYFTLGSLARLFRFCKFEVTNLMKEYFDQYLLIEAKPVTQKSHRMFDEEDTVADIARNVAYFSTQCQEKLTRWKNLLEQIKSAKKKAIVWGSGSKCVAFMTTLGVKDEIEYIVDINPHRHGKFIPGVGKQIVSPAFLKEYRPDIVIVMNPVYCDEIKGTLNTLGLTAEFIPCS